MLSPIVVVIRCVSKDTKTHKARRFPYNQVLRELLASIRPSEPQSDDLVFTSLTRLPINNEYFLNDVWRGCKRHGKPHDGIVTLLVKEGLVERYRTPVQHQAHLYHDGAGGWSHSPTGRYVGG